MCRHKQLFDAVGRMAKDYGVSIFSESRFWGMLTDLYPFPNETELKETYKTCVSNGWVAKVASLDNKSRLVKYIDHTVAANGQKSREDLAGCLFSVAIATGRCSEEDFTDFLKRPGNKKSKGVWSDKKSHTVFLNVCIVIIAIIGVPLGIVMCVNHTFSKGDLKKEPVTEYEKKIIENEERLENRRYYDSVPGVKNIMLGSDYSKAIRHMKADEDFKNCEEGYYELDNSGRFHPIFKLMNNGIQINTKGQYGESESNDIIRGRVFISTSFLDTIPIKLKVFELDGKVPFMTIEGTADRISFHIDALKLLKLYLEKYGVPEVRTYDGMPYNPEKYYPPANFIEARHEDFVWTFSQGVIRYGLNKILYATSDFVNSIINQFERTRLEYGERQRAERLRELQDSLRILKEDSIRRIRNHENAINNI